MKQKEDHGGGISWVVFVTPRLFDLRNYLFGSRILLMGIIWNFTLC